MLGYILHILAHGLGTAQARLADKRPPAARLRATARLVMGTGALVFVLGFGAAAVVSREQAAGDASAGWPQAPGCIEQSGIIESDSRPGSCYPSVRYAYTVSGQTYRGDKLSFNTPAAGREAAARVVARYPARKPVQVYYDPDNPARSVLEAGLASGSRMHMTMLCLMFPAGGLVTMVVGWCLWRKAVRQLKPPAPAADGGQEGPFRAGW